MIISRDKPPIWDEAQKHFEIDHRITVFTYGDTLYNPAGIYIDADLMAHEQTHSRQQAATEGGPAAWWQRYFADPDFRKVQELDAYQNQYEHYCRTHKGHEQRFRYRMELARTMASNMYKTGILTSDAMGIIKGKAHK